MRRKKRFFLLRAEGGDEKRRKNFTKLGEKEENFRKNRKNSHIAGLPTSYLASPIGIDSSVLKKVCPETSSQAPSRGISFARS